MTTAGARPLADMPAAFTALHDDARRILTTWRAPSSALDETRSRMLGVLDADAGAMWLAHSRVHFTASLVVLDPRLSHVALTLHGKAKRWFQFGGHLEATDSGVRDAAAREGREESGLDELDVSDRLVHVDAHTLPSAFGWCHEHLDMRYAATARSRELTVGDESDDVRWWPLDALPPGLEASLRNAIDLARLTLAAP